MKSIPPTYWHMNEQHLSLAGHRAIPPPTETWGKIKKAGNVSETHRETRFNGHVSSWKSNRRYM